MDLWTLHRGDSPLVIDVPHAGTHVPDALRPRLTAIAQTVPDTDWHVEKLYAFAAAEGATLFCATHSRYVVDLNRDPSGAALYAGADNTELCPTRTFGGEAIYGDGRGVRHRGHACGIRIFEMVGGQRTRGGRQRCAAGIGQLVGVQFHGQPMRARRREHALRLHRREADRLTERIDGVGGAGPRDRGNHFAADVVDVVVGARSELRRERMRR